MLKNLVNFQIKREAVFIKILKYAIFIKDVTKIVSCSDFGKAIIKNM